MSRLSETGERLQRFPEGLGADKSAFVGRLKIILSHWPSADRLARAMGVSPSAFRKWLKGEAEPSRERLVALARAAGVGVAWLADGEGPVPAFGSIPTTHRRGKPPEATEEVDWDQFVVLPDQPVAAAGTAAHAMQAYIAVRQDWVRSVCGADPEHLRLFLVPDQSMMPTIKSGDTLLVDTADRLFRTLGVYVIEINGERMVKRVQRRHDGSLFLTCDNAACQPELLDREAAGQVGVIGRVVWAGGTI